MTKIDAKAALEAHKVKLVHEGAFYRSGMVNAKNSIVSELHAKTIVYLAFKQVLALLLARRTPAQAPANYPLPTVLSLAMATGTYLFRKISLRRAIGLCAILVTVIAAAKYLQTPSTAASPLMKPR